MSVNKEGSDSCLIYWHVTVIGYQISSVFMMLRTSGTSLCRSGEVLEGSVVVIIPAGVPRKPGMTRDDLFNINAGIAKALRTAIAQHCPNATPATVRNSSDQDTKPLTKRALDGMTDIIEVKAGKGSASLSMA